MGLFGKPKISELEASVKFVMNMSERVKREWPRVAQSLGPMLGEDAHVLEEQFVSYEFMLPAIVMELQAAHNLLPESAPRIRAHVLHCLQNDDLGTYPEDSIAEYQKAWDDCLQQNEIPMNGLASVLFDKLGCTSSIAAGNGRIKSPMTLMLLTAAITDCCGMGFWKTVATKLKLTRD